MKTKLQNLTSKEELMKKQFEKIRMLDGKLAKAAKLERDFKNAKIYK